MVAQKIAGIRCIVSISEVTGIFDIICICVFRDSEELFHILENIKIIERVNKVVSSEEVQFTRTNSSQVFGLRSIMDSNKIIITMNLTRQLSEYQ